MTFLSRWLLASIGFACLELATRPHRRPVDRVTVWPGGLITPLGAELRTRPANVEPDPEPAPADERRTLCLSACCRKA